MNTYTQKPHDSKIKAAANTVTQKQSGSTPTLQLADNRPGAVAQQKIQEAVKNYVPKQPAPIQRAENKTGMPDNLKLGIENLSGYAMDDVKVQYNSNKPAQLNAHAYAQGNNIHIAPGQEKHLPHEAWHVVQQKQGRVRPTLQMKGGVNVNDDKGLEREADVMGRIAINKKSGYNNTIQKVSKKGLSTSSPIQRAGDKLAFNNISRDGEDSMSKSDTQKAGEIQTYLNEQKAINREKKRSLVSYWIHFVDHIQAEQQRIRSTVDSTEKIPNIKEAHEKFLEDYKKTGWNKQVIISHIASMGCYVDIASDNKIVIRNKITGHQIFEILSGDERFQQLTPEDGDRNSIFKKIGTDKQYVEDARGTKVPRYTRRAITREELEQYHNPESGPFFLPRKVRGHDAMPGLGASEHDKFDFPGEKIDTLPTDEEREFLQNRDGTENQWLLSTTTTKYPIRGNHGDDFNKDFEQSKRAYGGTFVIDLSKIRKEDILDQHYEESMSKKSAKFEGWKQRGTNERKSVYTAEDRERLGLKPLPKSKDKGYSAEQGMAEGNKSAIRNREIHLKLFTKDSIALHIPPEERNVETEYLKFLKGKKQTDAQDFDSKSTNLLESKHLKLEIELEQEYEKDRDPWGSISDFIGTEKAAEYLHLCSVLGKEPFKPY
ncbi:DUF4157 domain-containing protein [Flavobacterium sp. LaA7.5]|nr:DUF4157 domain-containing protein [Flavobacterium salilacus subsp. altitudinum]